MAPAEAATYAVYQGKNKIATGLESEQAAKTYAERALKFLIPSAGYLDWTPRGHLFYDNDGALVPSEFSVRLDGEEAPTEDEPTKRTPFLSFSGKAIDEKTRFLYASPSKYPRLWRLDELVDYLRAIYNFTDNGDEDETLWALLPGIAEPFQVFIAETETIEERDGKPFKVASKLVAHIPLTEDAVTEGMSIRIVYRNGAKTEATLFEIKHSSVYAHLKNRDAPELIHWTAIRALFERRVLGVIEWEVA